LSRDAFVGNARRECGAFSARQFGGTGVSDAITEFMVKYEARLEARNGLPTNPENNYHPRQFGFIADNQATRRA
jgi:hypothetical protein